MISINNIPLNNPARGWNLLATTQPTPAFNYETTTYTITGKDGTNIQATTRTSSTIKLTIGAPKNTLPDLYTLLNTPQLTITNTQTPNKHATGTLTAATTIKQDSTTGYTITGFIIEIPSGSLRSQEVVTGFVAASLHGVTVTGFNGVTAPIQDAVVRFKGGITRPEFTDSSGSFFVFDGVLESGQFLRFHADSGRAWVTDSDVWEGGREVSGLVDYGGVRGVFELTPYYESDPAERFVQARLTQQAFVPGSGVQVRARNAFLI